LYPAEVCRTLTPAGNLHEPVSVNGKARILIVEDDSDVRRLYAIGLNQRGYEVKLAANGAEAVERIESERPDVILLDWLMPLMDGEEVLNRLSREEGRPAVPIIVISGHPKPEGVALDPRIRCWLAKPVSIDDLVVRIEEPPRGAARGAS
jgi:CheY-like chemotaxis protein